MKNNDFLDSIKSQDQPSPLLKDPVQALWWLAKGDFKTGFEWSKAHEICQRNEGKAEHDLVHALAHWIEGDRFNSDYWYRQAGAARKSEVARDEWRHILDRLSAG